MKQFKIHQVGKVMDISTCTQDEKTILALAEDTNFLALDLSFCTYVSSAGLRVMLLAYKQLKIKGGRLDIIGVPDNVREVMAMTGFDQFFKFYNTAEEYIDQL